MNKLLLFATVLLSAGLSWAHATMYASKYPGADVDTAVGADLRTFRLVDRL